MNDFQLIGAKVASSLAEESLKILHKYQCTGFAFESIMTFSERISIDRYNAAHCEKYTYVSSS